MTVHAKKRPRASVVKWAKKVAEDEPHDFRELEDQLRDQAAPSQAIHPLTLVGTLALIAGVTVFMDASDGIQGDNGQLLTFNFGLEFELVTSALCFAVVCLFQARVLRAWTNNGRVRDSSTTWVSAIVAICCAIVLAIVINRSDFTDHTVWSVLAIAVTAVALCGGVAGLLASSTGRKPSTWHGSWNEPPMVNLAALPSEKQEPLLADREKALRTLARRGLLDADDRKLSELAARPLGRLADRRS